MPESRYARRIKVVVPLMSAAIVASFVLIGWSWYSSHQQACESRATTLNVMRDVILIATTPDSNHPLTPEQLRQVLVFRAAAFHRIDGARC